MAMIGKVSLFLVLILVVSIAGETKGPITITKPSNDAIKVNIYQGNVIGTTGKSLKGRSFMAFKGIPYALPPVGEKRFKPPFPVGPSDNDINATKEGNDCIQKNYLLPVKDPAVIGEEDCLYLNVYTPQIKPSEKLPVMVYIHGGGWFTGTGASYALGPEYLLDKDIVLVTFNYRLGAMGFLSTGDSEASGNYAMKDQVQVLRWVQDNIEAFGGNKSLVTIFGQSAGAVSVHYHMLSPMSKGLFHRAISQSGTVLSAWAWPTDPLPVIRLQGQFVKCPQENTTKLIQCLRNVDAHTLVDSGDQFHFWSLDPLTTFTPVLEQEDVEDPFLTEDPMYLLKNGEFSRVPWMLGVVPEEGIVRAVPIVSDPDLMKDLNNQWNTLGPKIFEMEKSVPFDQVDATWRNVTKFYLNDMLPVMPHNASGFISMYSDRSFVHGAHKSALLHAANDHRSVYMYQFDYRSSAHTTSYQFAFAPQNPRAYGVSHCDDLIYLFYTPYVFPDWQADPADLQVVDTLTTLWTNFAKYGDPTPTKSTSSYLSCSLHDGTTNDDCDLSEIKWSPIPTATDLNGSPPHTYYLHIRNTTANAHRILEFNMERDLFRSRMKFWDETPLYENTMTSVSAPQTAIL